MSTVWSFPMVASRLSPTMLTMRVVLLLMLDMKEKLSHMLLLSIMLLL